MSDGLKPTRRETMFLNMGPSHPAMHGIIRILLELDGETVVHADVEIGYLHRAFEKMAEQGGYLQVIPYTDRLNYVSPLINNFGYVGAVEKLFGIEITERAKYIRVIMSEISRVTDHLTCIGASAMELGAFTVFLYMIKAREFLYELIEEVTGARLTVSYARVGGVKADLTPDFKDKTMQAIKETRKVLKEVDSLLTRNRIFVDRMKGVGLISRETALGYGITGPFLRSTGVDYDVRKYQPHWGYDRFDFDIPVGECGDNFDRYLVRMEEMEQSMRIVEQALDQIPEGELNVDTVGCGPGLGRGSTAAVLAPPVGTDGTHGGASGRAKQGPLTAGRVIAASEMVDDAKMGKTAGLADLEVSTDPTLDGSTESLFKRVNVADKRLSTPPKEETYGNIEGLMHHFKIVMQGHGIRPPKGEVYFPVEGANGELGFYVVSDGTDRPYRVRVRPPCFPIMAALGKILEGGTIADIVPTFGSVNMIGGELDR